MQLKMTSGFFLINKEKGPTSFDIVSRVRKTFDIKKVGHAGTLDPLASGLLIVVVGNGTKLLEYVVGHNKTYEAEIKLGYETETYDREGEEIVIDKKFEPSKKEVIDILKSFLGKQQQVPPIYSAKKQDGKPLYKKARAGEKVKAKSQDVEILNLKLTEYKFPFVKFSVECSSGTYIRSLAYDIGKKLKTGAYLSKLKRNKIGSFNIKDAKETTKISTKDMKPLVELLPEMPKLIVSPAEIEKIRNGQPLHRVFRAKHSMVMLIDNKNNSIAIASYDKKVKLLKPKKVLISS
ncbi:MAG: tRNA pseudouridine(55) synthase TruB [bacterium]